MSDFNEVAERVWVARYEWADANVTAIETEGGLVVVDTHASTEAGRRIVGDLSRLGRGEVVAIVNTHVHWDHTFGNAAFTALRPDLPIYAHEHCAEDLAAHAQQVLADPTRIASTPQQLAELEATTIVAPNRVFSSVSVVEIGDRHIELVYPGRGHTRGDLVVRVPDVDVLLAGDLVEESANPWYGDDAWPFEWPTSLDLVIGLTTDSTRVIPGHGEVVDRDFVGRQRDELAHIAEQIRELAGSGVPVSDAVAEGTWPWTTDARIENAVRRGYAQLPRDGRRLPLV